MIADDILATSYIKYLKMNILFNTQEMLEFQIVISQNTCVCYKMSQVLNLFKRADRERFLL